ncbi:MAG TPA: hypothetical protein VHW67_01440 [Solirubrobacteraceae bacterium]|jgi:Ni/Co efflux regulator RcnB|nr:hypothetical protein [Solirubrobacteraceae bacterium]
MRRIIITAVAAVSLAAPSAALAHNGEHHGNREHHHHGRHHRRAHVLAFHAQAPAGTTGTTPATSTPAVSGDTAGTVASFSEGTLTIKLNDGSTVSGKVTERTEIECPATARGSTASAADFGDRDRGDDNDRFDNRGHDDGGPGPSGEDHGGCPGHDAGDDQPNEHCTSAALVPGASVKEAFLSLGSAGSVWVKVELG